MKRAIAVLVALVMVLSLVPAALAASNEATQAADALHSMGLFQGKGTNADGTPVYALDDTTSRSEAVTMLVRLLGKEAEAKAGTWNIPFTDVDSWAVPYVGYAYANGLTKGTSETTFGGNSLVSATQYITFVLRALGYDSNKDFQWDKAWELSDKIGFTKGQYKATSSFLRGDVAIVSNNALSAKMKGSDKSLLNTLGLGNDNDEPIKLSLNYMQGLWKWDAADGRINEVYFVGDRYYSYCAFENNLSGRSTYSCDVGTAVMNGNEIRLNYEANYSGTYSASNDLKITNNFAATSSRNWRVTTDGKTIYIHKLVSGPRELTRVDTSRFCEMTKAVIVANDNIYEYLINLATEKGTLENGVYKYQYDTLSNIDQTPSGNRIASMSQYYICYNTNNSELSFLEEAFSSLRGNSSSNSYSSVTTYSLVIDSALSGNYLVRYASYKANNLTNPDATALAHIDSINFSGASSDIEFEQTQGIYDSSKTIDEATTSLAIRTTLVLLKNNVLDDTIFDLSGLKFYNVY